VKIYKNEQNEAYQQRKERGYPGPPEEHAFQPVEETGSLVVGG
jgi:hypothetical protein